MQLCRNLNTVLANADALGRHPGSMYDVLYLENEAGYIIENLNPTAEGYYYAWDQKNNKIVYIQDDLQTVYYPEDYTVVPSDCWITASTAEEMTHLSDFGYNIALENDIEEAIELHNVVSINTLGFKIGNVTMNAGSIVPETVNLIGSFGNTNINAGATNVVTSGTMTGLNVQGSGSVTLGGFVNSYSASSGVSSVVSSTGMVNTIASGSSSNITNNGVVRANSGSGSTSGNAVGKVEGNVVNVSSKEGIESIRTQVASGNRNFKGETITMTEDINMNGIAFMPVSNFSREGRDKAANTGEDGSWFQGHFDGQGHAIQNFSNNGFEISGLNAGTNDSSVAFGESKIIYSEAVYGLFGTVYNTTIENLTITVDIDMTLDSANKYVGDSVGAIIGFAYGNKVTLKNCVVSGTIKGYDGVGGLIGRCYATNLEFINCTNNANVTGVRKTGGFCGSSSGCTVTYTNCVNNGTITCLGTAKEEDLVAWNMDKKIATTKIVYDASKHGSGYYIAAAGTVAAAAKTTDDGFTNNGQVIVAGNDFKGSDGNYWINK